MPNRPAPTARRGFDAPRQRVLPQFHITASKPPLPTIIDSAIDLASSVGAQPLRRQIISAFEQRGLGVKLSFTQNSLRRIESVAMVSIISLRWRIYRHYRYRRE